MKTKLFFIHVPKTAGTSLVHAFKESENDVLHRDKNNKVKNFEEYNIIFGHIHPDTYQNIPKVIFLRNPVERMISHYNHWKYRLETHGKNMIMCYPGRTMSFWKHSSIIDFASKVGNIYQAYTNYNLHQFEFVGFTEEMDYYTKKMSDKFGLNLKLPLSRKRIGIKQDITDKELSLLKSQLYYDIQFYEQALSERG